MAANPFLETLNRLSAEYAAEYKRNVERYARFVGELSQAGAASGLSPSVDEAQRRYAELFRGDYLRVAGQLAEAGMSYYLLLVRSWTEATNRFWDQARRTVEQPAATPTGKAQPGLLFRGKRGDSPSNGFIVANSQPQPVEVSFDMTELVSDDGAQRLRPEARFVPALCLLAPNAEKVIQCSMLLSEAFEPGVIYHGRIRVAGSPETTIQVAVEVEAPAPAPEAAVAEPAQTRRRTSRTSKKKPRAAKT